jgi:hypothetical protein
MKKIDLEFSDIELSDIQKAPSGGVVVSNNDIESGTSNPVHAHSTIKPMGTNGPANLPGAATSSPMRALSANQLEPTSASLL